MKLLVTWDGQGEDEDFLALPRARDGTTTFRLEAEDAKGQRPPGTFWLSGDETRSSIPGQPENPHYVLAHSTESPRSLSFEFHFSSGAPPLVETVSILSWWERPLARLLVVLSLPAAAGALWLSHRGFSVWLSAWESVREVAATGLSGLVAGLGLQVVPWRSFGWQWKRAAALVLCSWSALLGLRALLVRVDNRTGEELEREDKKIASLGSEVVSRSWLGRNLLGNGRTWMRERWFCTHASTDDCAGEAFGGTCECQRQPMRDPWWSALPLPTIEVGCATSRVDPAYGIEWDRPTCVAPSDYEARVSFGRHELVVRPLEGPAEALDAACLDLSEYRQLVLGPSAIDRVDQTLELQGRHRLRAVILQETRSETSSDPASVCRRKTRPGAPPGSLRAPVFLEEDRVLLGTARLGEVEIGRLMCRLSDENISIARGYVQTGLRIARATFRRGDELVSTFDVTRPDLATALPMCTERLGEAPKAGPKREARPVRVEVFLAASWQPGGFSMLFPAGAVPESVDIFLADGRSWGTVGWKPKKSATAGSCKSVCAQEACVVQPVWAGVTDPVLSAQQPAVPAKGQAGLLWHNSGVADFPGYFWTCGKAVAAATATATPSSTKNEGPKYRVELERTGVRDLQNERLSLVPPRACAISDVSGDELLGVQATSCPNEVGDRWIPAGCSRTLSKVCP